MKSLALLLFFIWAISGALCEDEFLPALEPEEIMKVEVQPGDVTDKGMAETLKDAEGANPGELRAVNDSSRQSNRNGVRSTRACAC